MTSQPSPAAPSERVEPSEPVAPSEPGASSAHGALTEPGAPSERGALSTPGSLAEPGAAPDPSGRSVPSTDELRVLLTGLDPLGAAVALALADAGVCLFNVADPSPVRALDAREGPYPLESEGLARELALRSVLRRRSPRCAPITAPELFPSAAVHGAVVLHAWSVAGDLVRDLEEPPRPEVDPALPTLTVVGDGPCVVRWPVTDWSHRPCRECVVAAVRTARRITREHPLLPREPLLPARAGPVARLTRTVAAGEIAGILLSLGLGADIGPPCGHDGPSGSAGSDHGAPGQEAGKDVAEGHVTDGLGRAARDPAVGTELGTGPLLGHGLRRIPLQTDPACLCALAFVEP